MIIFITGGTGFLGKNLLLKLNKKASKIYILTRNTTIKFPFELDNFELIEGDITTPEVIKNAEDRKKVRDEVTHVIHAAAFYKLDASHEECYLQNVVGTQNILHFLKTIDHLKLFTYISTIAVASETTYLLDENKLNKRTDFTDHYSKTKYIAENLVRESKKNLNCKYLIVRPGIIVGNSETGEMDKIDGPYYFINAFKKYENLLKSLKYIPLSYNKRTKIPIIPVDHCAHFIVLLIEREKSLDDIETVHLISHETPSVSEFLDDLKEKFNIKANFMAVFRNPVHDNILKFLGIPKEVIPFMFSKVSYDKTRTNRLIPEILESKYSSFKDSLLK